MLIFFKAVTVTNGLSLRILYETRLLLSRNFEFAELKKMSNETLTSTFSDMRQRLLAMATRITGNRDDANDAVQEAFCKLWLKRDKINSRQAAEGMSVVTVHHVSIDTVRRRAANNTVSVDEERDNIAEEVVPNRSEVFNEVKAIIDKELNETQRRIVHMREFEGKSFNEIAHALNMQPINVRVQLSRARKLVREIYRRKQE